MVNPILEIKNLSIEFSTPRGLIRPCENIFLTIRRGDLVGIIGESGSGKSTLANGILRVLKAKGQITQGEILYYKKNGEIIDLTKITQQEYRSMRWTHITTVFQAAQNVLNPTLTIREHFIETFLAHKEVLPYNKQYVLEKINSLLKKVRLEERVLDAYPHQLSGGMKQRAIIALSLILEPDILILDEPTTALDVITQWYIIDILKKIHVETGITMIFLTHDVSIIASIVDKIAVMYCAQIAEYGSVDDVFSKPLHPYTQGLLQAIPSITDDVGVRKSILGYPPDLLHIPKACRFAPRCFICQTDPCIYAEKSESSLIDTGDNHFTMCRQWQRMKEQ